MTRLNEIDRCKDIKFFVKFVNQEHLDMLLDGDLYMNTLGHFIEQEERTNIRGQGDKYEGAHVFDVYNVKIIDSKTNQVIAIASEGTLKERYESIREIPVFCYTMFSAKDFKVIEEKGESVSFKLDIDINDKNKILEDFGDKAVLLPSNFIDLISEEADSQNLEYISRPVKYIDFSFIDLDRKKRFEEGAVEMITWKDKHFDYQREMRFAILNKHTVPQQCFKINSIRKQSGVMDTRKFLNDYYIEINFREGN